MSAGAGFQTTLHLHDVSKRFVAGVGACSVGVTALRSASVEIRTGEVLVVAGPRGSGKTTLLLCAAGLLRCDSGEILGTGRRVVYRDLLQPARTIDPMCQGAVLLLDSCDDAGELTRVRAMRVVADALAAGAAVVLAAREPASCFSLIPAAATISVVHLRLGETWGPRQAPAIAHRVAESAGSGY